MTVNVVEMTPSMKWLQRPNIGRIDQTRESTEQLLYTGALCPARCLWTPMPALIPLPALSHHVPQHCSACGAASPLALGDKDFAYSCNDHFEGQPQFPSANTPVRYHRCGACQFTFTACLDSWSAQDFHAHIYNADYVLADPVFTDIRPARNSQMVAALWHRALQETVVLDFGGGDGAFARGLQAMGHQCHTVDPFHGEDTPSLLSHYELITCFEVIEHVPHGQLDAWFDTLLSYLSPQGTLLLSTELLDADMRLSNWYIAPRNGHISMHTAASLKALASRHGLSVFSLNHEMHVLRRQPAVAA
jgi:2-polyprenyl-3-methyl-5-hydroxy-6-metoxy-1,4-benzoquinol methylase